MGESLTPLIGPCSLMESPMIFMIRPRVVVPTTTMMSLLVPMTLAPQTRPSVLSMAMIWTEFALRWDATSRTRWPPLKSMTSRVLRIGGMLSVSNWTSTMARLRSIGWIDLRQGIFSSHRVSSYSGLTIESARQRR